MPCLATTAHIPARLADPDCFEALEATRVLRLRSAPGQMTMRPRRDTHVTQDTER